MPEESYKPQLQIATFCQSALQEINGSLSIIRLIDRHMIQGSQPEMLPTNIETTLVIVMKSGFMRGKAMIGVQCNTPSGKQLPMIQLPVLFEGEDRGDAEERRQQKRDVLRFDARLARAANC